MLEMTPRSYEWDHSEHDSFHLPVPGFLTSSFFSPSLPFSFHYSKFTSRFLSLEKDCPALVLWDLNMMDNINCQRLWWRKIQGQCKHWKWPLRQLSGKAPSSQDLQVAMDRGRMSRCAEEAWGLSHSLMVCDAQHEERTGNVQIWR